MYKEYIVLALAVTTFTSQLKSNPHRDSANYFKRNYPNLTYAEARRTDSLLIMTNIDFSNRFGHYISLPQREMIVRDLKKQKKLNPVKQ